MQFGIIRQLVSLAEADDLQAEPDLPGVRWPQAKFTSGWACALDAGPNGANTACTHDVNGYNTNDIGDVGRPTPSVSCPTMQFCLGS